MAGPLFFVLANAPAALANGPFPTFSGISAAAEDAGVASTNPAAMTRFDERAQRVDLFGFFSDSTWEWRAGDQGPVRVTEDSSTSIVPQVSLVEPIGERWWFGFSVLGNAFSEDYGDDWLGRYYLQEYELLTIRAFPSLATRLSDRWSVAVSLPISYTSYEQRKAVRNLDPGFDDGSLVIETDGLEISYGVSLLYELSEQTRFGLTYRAAEEPSMNGNLDFRDLGPITEGVFDRAGLLDARVDVTTRLPQWLTLGVYHQFDNGHALTADVVWAETSDFVLAEIFVNDRGILENRQDYEDIIAVSGSYSWPVADRWRVGVGGTWVSELVEDANRTLTLRMDELWTVGAGFSWAWRPDRTVDFTLNYLEIGDAPVSTPALPGIGTIEGRFTERRTIYFRAAVSFGLSRG